MYTNIFHFIVVCFQEIKVLEFRNHVSIMMHIVTVIANIIPFSFSLKPSPLAAVSF